MSIARAALESVTPAKGEAAPFTAGCLGTGCLHAIVTVAFIALGTRYLGREGGLLVLPFWSFLGILQWLYLAPLALLLRRLRLIPASKGVWFAGSCGVLLTALYWSGLAAMSLAYQRQAEEVRREQREHPIAHREVTGTIVAADAKRLDVQTAEGVVSLALVSTTHYIRTDRRQGNRAATRDIVRVGASVLVKASSFDGGPLYADYVNLEAPEPEGTPTPP
jgi:hypothetical protein